VIANDIVITSGALVNVSEFELRDSKVK
jgi:hypothetical protein